MGLFQKIATIISAVLAIAGIIFLLTFFLLKILWAWTIPDLFPGAVTQGLVAAEISWWTSFKLALFLAVIGGFLRSNINIDN